VDARELDLENAASQELLSLKLTKFPGFFAEPVLLATCSSKLVLEGFHAKMVVNGKQSQGSFSVLMLQKKPRNWSWDGSQIHK
jgi:hypothetical protein